MNKISKILLAISLSLYGILSQAQMVRDSVEIRFYQNRIGLDKTLADNGKALARIVDSLQTSYGDSILRLRRIHVVGGASPEGSILRNKWLSEQRAQTLFDYLSAYGQLPDSLKTTEFLGRDWNGLVRLVEDDPKVPYREETLDMLRQIEGEAANGEAPVTDPLKRIRSLRGGVPYRYMYNNLFPKLRASRLYLWYERVWNPTIPRSRTGESDRVPLCDTIYAGKKLQSSHIEKQSSFYRDSESNMPHCIPLQTQMKCDSVGIRFRQNRIGLDMTLADNRKALARIVDSLQTSYGDSIWQLRRIHVVGGASPEGSIALNKWLSERRAQTLFDYLSTYGQLPDSLKTTEFLGRDWNGLVRLVEEDPEVPYRKETLAMLRQIAAANGNGETSAIDPLRRIRSLRGGVPYRYMYKYLFPKLRTSRLYLWYERVWKPVIPRPQPMEMTVQPLRDTVYVVVRDTIYVEKPQPFHIKEQRPFYMGLKTNMLYDALAVPNIGVEFYLGKNWSVAANWMYAWWKNDSRHRYWRIYGGEIGVRKWLGKVAARKPLQGHHIGLYAQAFTYDFEWGGNGQMAGKPGGDIFDRTSYAFGLEYGYSLPVARRLNIDFSLGVGYMGGTYYKYKPIEDCYVWQSTHKRHWFGPTKAEISLVWLIGNGNTNGRKGGKQ